jgi:hypothetical protein
MATPASAPPARAPRLRVALAGAAVLAALLPAVAAAPSAQAAIPVPARPALPAQVDAYATYQGQSACTPTPKPGAVRLARLLTTTYGRYPIGIARACSIGGRSEHKEGRALDWMVSVRVAGQSARATAFLRWLLAAGPDGRPAEMARRLGVMYIGWNNRFWAAYRPDAGWTDLKGCTTDPAKRARGYDTLCHRNHVHLSLSWEGAAGLTSFWTGVALAPPCETGWDQGGGGLAGAQPAGAGTDLVPVPPVRVLDTRSGTGLAAPCRLTAAQAWDGSRRDAVVRVTGVGAVPDHDVAAVAVRVTTYRTSAPVPTVSVRTTATSASRPVTTSLSAAGYSATTVVPVADDGTIRFAVDRGSADLQVEVVGWVPLVVPVPTPDPTDPSASPTDPAAGPTAPVASPAVGADAGRTHVLPVTLVYDGSRAPLAPRETRTVRLGGVGPVPASGLTGLALTLTTARAAAAGSVGVLTGSLRTYVGSLRSSTTTARATQLVAPTTDGTVVLRNTGSTPVAVRLYVNAWFSADSTPGGATMTMLPAPVRVVDSAARVGLSGPTTSGAARLVRLTGTAGVPAGARGVLVAVSALGGATDATLTIGSVRPVPAVSSVRRQWSHEVVLLPLAPTGLLTVQTPSLGSQVRIWVLGYVA